MENEKKKVLSCIQPSGQITAQSNFHACSGGKIRLHIGIKFFNCFHLSILPSLL